MPKPEYDDDIFTLKEDELHKRRGHMIQYALVSLFAVLVIGVALYMSYWLTQRRIEDQSQIVQEDQVNTTEEQGVLKAWPSAQFPSVPVLESSVYETHMNPEGTHAEIRVPPAVSAKFAQYAEDLANDGAQVYIKSDTLIVLSHRDVEIHLVKRPNKDAIELCAEPRATWNEPEYAAFPLPNAGDLVNWEKGTGEKSRWLTYRQMSASDAISYVSELAQSDWILVGTLEPVDHIFSCSFKKDNMQIAVDYFATTDNCRLKLDILD